MGASVPPKLVCCGRRHRAGGECVNKLLCENISTEAICKTHAPDQYTKHYQSNMQIGLCYFILCSFMSLRVVMVQINTSSIVRFVLFIMGRYIQRYITH